RASVSGWNRAVAGVAVAPSDGGGELASGDGGVGVEEGGDAPRECLAGGRLDECARSMQGRRLRRFYARRARSQDGQIILRVVDRDRDVEIAGGRECVRAGDREEVAAERIRERRWDFRDRAVAGV